MMTHEFMADLERRLASGLGIPKTMCDESSSATRAHVQWEELRAAVQRGTVSFEKFARQLNVLAFRKYIQKGEGLRYIDLTRKQRRKRIRIDRRHGRATSFLYAGKGFNKKVVFPKIRFPVDIRMADWFIHNSVGSKTTDFSPSDPDVADVLTRGGDRC